MAFTIPEDHVKALTALARLDGEQFSDLVALLHQETPTAFPTKVAGRIAEKFKQADVPNPGALVDSLYQMLRTRENLGQDDGRFLNAILDGIDEGSVQPFSSEERAEAYRRISALIDASTPISRSFKAHDVLTSHQNVYRESRILTDIRPVFGDGENMSFSDTVTVHMLQISYSENGQRKRFYVALDSADLGSLRKVIERAEFKNGAINRKLGELDIHVSSPEH